MSEPDTASVPSPGDGVADDLWLALVPGIGPRLRQELLERLGSAAAVRKASAEELRSVPGIGAKLCQSIVEAQSQLDVAEEIERCRRHGIDVLGKSRSDYPRMLREIHDPPGVLFAKGRVVPPDDLAIAIVGSRHATHYGLTHAKRLAASLARAGLTIVSGLARGIDAAAHRGALEANGRTIAVLASGLLKIYPPEHKELAVEVAANGALLSEAPPLAAPVGGAFPQRNRLISGLSLGVIIVEAAERSGALITARHASEQDREVFAVPGRIDSRMSRGCHRLLRDGAKLVETADDVLEELGPLSAPTSDRDGTTIRHPAELKLNDVERQVLSCVDTAPTSIDDVVTQSGLTTPQVLATINVLETRRLLHRTAGHLVVRC